MEKKSFEVYCVNGHLVDKLCISKSCSEPAAVCREESCKYSKAHTRCRIKIDVENVIERFEEKIASTVKEADEIILSFFNKMIKDI